MREERVASLVLHDLHNHRYRVVQFDYLIEQENNSERWNPAIVAAIEGELCTRAGERGWGDLRSERSATEGFDSEGKTQRCFLSIWTRLVLAGGL